MVEIDVETHQEKSWMEARHILHDEIRQFQAEYQHQYIMYSLKRCLKQDDNCNKYNCSSSMFVFLTFLSHNMDVVAALICSIALLVIGSIEVVFDLELFLAGVLSAACSLLSLFGIYRHNTMSKLNQHASLFEAMDDYLNSSEEILVKRTNNTNEDDVKQDELDDIENGQHSDNDNNSLPEEQYNNSASPFVNSSYNLSSDGDYYWVYRKVGENELSKSRWFKIPNLLIVEGDCIALQVGDIAPSRIQLLQSSNIKMDRGEKITLSHDLMFTKKLPLGKSTFMTRDGDDANCNKALSLAQNMQIYLVLDTPLRIFLKNATENRSTLLTDNRYPLAHRKIAQIRKHLQIFSGVLFSLTLIVILARFRTDIFSDSDEVNGLKYLLPLPFIVALSVLPITSPLILFLMEAIGTARVLTSTHILKLTSDNADSDDDDNKIYPSVFTYLGRTLFCRFFPKIKFIPSVDGNRQSLSIRYDHQNPSYITGRTDIFFESVPAFGWSMVEKLGSASALSLIDDELVCEDHSTPQQLLVPSSQGLKLLDLYPAFLEELDEHEDDSLVSSDSDSTASEDANLPNSNGSTKRTRRLLNIRRKLLSRMKSDRSMAEESLRLNNMSSDEIENEVQFEDPLWWKFLPSLKAIGLACLLIHQSIDDDSRQASEDTFHDDENESALLYRAQSSLVPHICRVQQRSQLVSLAHCIGFARDLKDIEYFSERRRLHIVSTQLLHERIAIDSHALGLEEGRGRGLLRPDSTSVVVHDMRTKACQMLTVGDPLVVSGLCSDTWQGENSTIMPLTLTDRAAILEASKNWNLADLDVAVFSYAPVPHITQKRIGSYGAPETAVLIDNRSSVEGETIVKDSGMDWTLVNNQIFLGMLGSSIRPRRGVKPLLNQCDDAGIRFVYFSPRNMRRTKELASQMGLEVGWNCAISLRDLDEGEIDDHRMPSTYADWDVNAKLPHGVSEVRQHLEEVDDVPLLVGLYTDVTCDTTEDMVRIFREYGDTVVTVGLIHGSRHSNIFTASDLAIGVDLLGSEMSAATQNIGSCCENSPMLSDFRFVTAAAAHNCAFKLRGVHAIDKIPEMIKIGRASYEAIYNGVSLIVCGYISLAFTAFFSSLSASNCIPFIPPLGGLLFVLLILPLLGLSLAFTDSSDETMQHVPAKNENERIFMKHEKKSLYIFNIIRSLLPSCGAHLIYLISFGELFIALEPSLAAACGSENSWASIIQCSSIKSYSGPARSIASSIMVSELALCSIALSPGFFVRTMPLGLVTCCTSNRIWAVAAIICTALTAVYLTKSSSEEVSAHLPWYFFLLVIIWPFMCLVFSEILRKSEVKDEVRADMLRRLQFETRLGMWSPK